MKQARFLSPLTLLTTFALTAAAPAPLSDPVGVYASIDRVVLEPNAQDPRAIQIWGVFALSTGQPGDSYQPAERGYLYYSVNARNPRATRAEWSDLRSMAGTGRPLGFGGRYEKLGRVRRPAEAPANPDTYPLGFGLVKMLTAGHRPNIEHALLRVPTPLTPADGGSVAPGQVRLVARNVADASVQYVFEIENGSERETSRPIAPGNAETSWSPQLRLQAGRTYTWRVFAVKGEWKGAPAIASFRAGD